MGIHWQRQELDLEIMKMLYEYGPIRARTFVDVFSNHKQQKVYDRLRELRRMEMLDSEAYVGESDEEQSSNRIKKPKKYGKVYFLTSYGVERTKLLVYGAEKDGNERSQRPDDKEIATYWKASLLMSNIPLKFMPKRIFKRKYDLPNNMMIDLGYKRWAITFARNSTETHRARLAHQMSVMVNRGHSKNLILCNTRAQQLSLVKYFRTAYTPGVYVLVFNDYDTITRLLTDTVMEDTIQTLQDEVGPVERLDPPQDGYKYRVNNQYANIYPLVGFPIEQMIKLEKSVTLPGYIALADIQQYKQIIKHYSKLLAKYKPIIAKEYIHTLEEEPETPAEKERYRDWAAEINFDSI